MQAAGEHLIVRIPPKRKATDTGLVVEQIDQPRMYGRVESMGLDAAAHLDNIVGQYVVFDTTGIAPIALDPTVPQNQIVTVAMNYTNVFAVCRPEEIEKANLPT